MAEESSNRYSMINAARFRFGDWRATPGLNLLENEGESVKIEPQAMDVLCLLAAHAPSVVSIDDLVREVWKGRAVSDGPIYHRVKELRKALGDDARHPRYIHTIHKRGYRLAVPIEWLPDEPAETAASRLPRTLSNRWHHAIAALAIAILVLSILLYAVPSWIPTNDVVAVLPFEYTSGEEGQEYLGEGIAAELIHALSNAPGLVVIARTSSFSFENTSADAREISERLGASAILDGTVRLENGRLRVVAQLIDGDNGRNLWSQAFDRPLEELMALERDIAIDVAGQILGQDTDTSGVTAALGPVEEIDAYDYYLLGRHHLRNPSGRISAWTASEANQSIEHFQRAIEADPGFARAYAGLAEALLHGQFIGREIRSWDDPPPSELAGEISALIDQALTLDPQLAEAYVSRALFLFRFERDMEQGRAALRQAIALNPNLAVAHYELGKYVVEDEERLAEFSTAAQLDPLAPEVHMWLARTLKRMSRHEEAASHYERALMVEPTLTEAIIETALQKHSLGRPDEAIHVLSSLVNELGEPPTAPSMLEFAQAEIARFSLDLNDPDAADALLSSLEPSSRVINNRIQLAISTDRYDEVADLTHSWMNAPLAVAHGPYNHVNDLARAADGGPLPPLYEMMIGHDEHARDLFEDLASRSDLSSMVRDIWWGYYPAVNAAHLALKAGDTRMANVMLENARRALDLALEDQYLAGGAHYLLASVSAIEGDRDQALTSLREAISHGWTRHWYAVRDPNLENLHGDARFQSLIDNLKAEMDRLRLAM